MEYKTVILHDTDETMLLSDALIKLVHNWYYEKGGFKYLIDKDGFNYIKNSFNWISPEVRVAIYVDFIVFIGDYDKTVHFFKQTLLVPSLHNTLLEKSRGKSIGVHYISGFKVCYFRVTDLVSWTTKDKSLSEN